MAFIDIKVGGKSLVLQNSSVQILMRGFSTDNEIVLGSYTLPIQAIVCYENEQIFGSQYLLENANKNLIISDAALYIGGILHGFGFIRLLSATKQYYRFSFIYSPFSNLFYNKQLSSVIFNDALFWKGQEVPKSYKAFMLFLDSCIASADAYIPGYTGNTFTLPVVRCIGWDGEAKDSAGNTVSEFSSFEISNQEANKFDPIANKLIRNRCDLKTSSLYPAETLIADTVNLQKIIPQLYTAFILEQIWAEIGWQVSGELMQHEDFLREITVNSYAIDKYENAGYVEFEWSGASNWVDFFWETLKSKYAFGAFDNYNYVLYVPPVVSGTETKANLVWKLSVYLPNLSGLSLDTKFFLQDGILLTNLMEVYATFQPGPFSVGYYMIIEFDTEAIHGVPHNSYYNIGCVTTDIDPSELTIGGVTGVAYFKTHNYTSGESSQHHNNILDTNISFKNHVPNITVGEFIRSIIKKYGVTERTNYEEKTVYYDFLSYGDLPGDVNDITNIVGDDYVIEYRGQKTTCKFTGQNLYNFDKNNYNVGKRESYVDSFLNEIIGCPLTSTVNNAGVMAINIETKGSSKAIGNTFEDGLLYSHYKGLQSTQSGAYLAPFASSNNILFNGTAFSAFKFTVKYLIDTYWLQYLNSREISVVFPIKISLLQLLSLNLNKIITLKHNQYFAEELIVNVEPEGIKDAEIKMYQA
jgi:hypothetical protein